ncbi:hypothetical protein AB3N02_22745 [Priestia aryabhattai]|uniref:hypothetical protein n=1 Tax=Priestia aryabhattai TaxID=412384 RepID=UPI0039A350A3
MVEEISVVSKGYRGDFEHELARTISNMQDKGLVVEIKFSTAMEDRHFEYSAVVLGYAQEEASE